jgi:hypothetical protein
VTTVARFGPKADKRGCSWNVRFVPDAAINRGGKLVLVAQSQHIINVYRDRHYDDAEADMI